MLLMLEGACLWRVEAFRTAEGHEPFSTWLDSLEIVEQSKVAAYVERVACGGNKRTQNKDILQAKKNWRLANV